MTERQGPAAGRRLFLKHGVAVAGGAAALAVAGGAATAGGGAESPAASDAQRPQGYRLTPHIERYYRLARR